MKAESRIAKVCRRMGRLRRFQAQGVSLFASGLSVFLLILIGVPLIMVVLMSLRTGFPGRGRAAHACQFHRRLQRAQHLSRFCSIRCCSPWARYSSRLLRRAAGLAAHAHRYAAQENDLCADDRRHFDPGLSPHHRLDLVAQPAHRLGEPMGDAVVRSRSAAVQSLQHYREWPSSKACLSCPRVLHARGGLPHDGPVA